MRYRAAVRAMVDAITRETHQLGPCNCPRCIAHRLALEEENEKHTINQKYRDHLGHLRQRTRLRVQAAAQYGVSSGTKRAFAACAGSLDFSRW